MTAVATATVLSFKVRKMTKITEVKIRIESSIENLDSTGLVDGEVERSVEEAEGFYRYSDEGATLTYAIENEGGRAESEIMCAGGAVTVKRRGAIESELLFEEGVCHTSLYCVPPYKFDTAVTAKRVRLSLDERGGRIDLLYNMKIGGAEKSARMKIWISPFSNQI